MKLRPKIFTKDINPDIEKRFDSSDYPTNNPSGIKTGLNSKVLGMFKDEAGGKQIVEFVGLRAILLQMLDGSEDKKFKGGRKEQHRKMNVIRSHCHGIYTEEINEIALSSDDDKRVIMADGIHTLANGYTSLKNCN